MIDAEGQPSTTRLRAWSSAGKLWVLWAQLGILVVAAIAVGSAAAFAAGAWLQPGRPRVLAAAFAAAILAALVVSELTSHSIRHWWAQRPLAAETAAGLLLLTWTVLVVEAVVTEIFARADQQKSRSAGKAAAAILMSVVSTAMLEFQRATLWPATVAVDSFEDAGPEVDSGAARLGNTLTRAVLDVAGSLTATAELEALYEHAALAAGAARDLPQAIREWLYSHAGSLSLPTLESESARLSWWSGVMATWDRVVDQMTAFQVLAERELELLSDTRYAWRAPGPTEYEKARHAYLNEYGWDHKQ